MPTLGITWADKESGGQPKTVHIQQWWWEDANEVKNAINAHKALLDGGVIGNPLRAESFVKKEGLIRKFFWQTVQFKRNQH
jgi:hypothetical protein